MQTVNSNKKAQKRPASKTRSADVLSKARRMGIPEFMLRLAQEQHVKIFAEQFIPKYRHD